MKIWTFLIRGGREFVLTLESNPPLVHDGGQTIWKFLGSVSEAMIIEQKLQSCGGHITRYTEFETEEQRAERGLFPPT